MSMNDPIADMFTRIRNAQRVEKRSVQMPSSKIKLWDRIRGRLEPHEIMFPGLEKLPRMSMGQMQRVRDDLSNAGYMAAEGTVRPLPSASRAGYFAFPAAVGAGSYGLLGNPEEEQY